MPSNKANKFYLNVVIIAGCFMAIFCFEKMVKADEATTTDPVITEEVVDLNKVYINEICPHPSAGSEKEWVEIYNDNDQEVDLSNWKIKDNTASHKFIISENSKIGPKSFSVFVGKLYLNDTGGDSALLVDLEDKEISRAEYASDAETDFCYARDIDGILKWTTTCTNGMLNIITEPVEPSTTTGGGGGSSYSTNDTGASLAPVVPESKDSGYKDKILITEILPNPLGIDDDEWIELFNTTTEEYFLDNWKLRDNQTEYIIKNTKFPAKSFLILPKSQTKFVLNNGGDFVELIDLAGKPVARAEYKTAAKENESYNFCNKKWLWLFPTRGTANFCPPPNKLPTAFFEPTSVEFSVGEEVLLDAYESFDEDGKITKYTWEFAKDVAEIDSQKQGKIFEGDQPIFKFKFLSGGKQKISLTVLDDIGGEDKFSYEAEVAGGAEENGTKTSKKSTTKSSGYFAPVDLDSVRELEKNSKVLVQGIVSVEPGIFGADQFYLAGSGIQIYFSKKDFPKISLGDEVQVAGVLSSYYNEARIKVASQSDIKVLSQNNEAPTQHKIGLDEIGEETEGSLVTVSGEVTEIKAPYFWLDDGAGEIRAYVKKTTNIDFDKIDLKVGDFLTLTGIVSETSSGYRILPRYESDFKIGKTLGTATERQTKKSRWPYYVFPGILALGLIIGGIFWKKKKDKKESEEEIVKF